MNVPAGGGYDFRLRDLSDVGTYVVDDRGHIVDVNPRAEQILDRAASTLLGKDAHDLLHRGKYGEPLPRSRCTVRQALIAGETRQGDDEWLECGNGSLLAVSWLVTPYQNGEGDKGALVLFREGSTPGAAEGGRPSAASMAELDRLALLAEATATLTASLVVDDTVRQLIRLVVPLMADWAVVDLLTEEGGVSRAAVVHYENGVRVHRRDLEGPMPPVPQESSMPLSRALRGVTPSLVGPQDYQGPPDSDIAVAQRELFDETGMHSASIAPIRGVREVVGALTLGRSERSAAFTPDDMLLAEDIARRAGLALDNARLYERQRRVAETMQRHLLPTLPRVPGLQMAARYLPAPDASQVGGDWYDAFVLSDGSAGLVIGDVVGHDLDAAAGMAQVCNMLRAYAGEVEEPPSVIVNRLDEAVVRMAETTMATVVFARVERLEGAWRLRWTNAGHPPPLLAERDGPARFLDEGSGLLLGTGLSPDRDDAAVHLPPGAVLLLYTDGLIESPGHSLDEGLDRLARQASSLADRPLGTICDALLANVRPTDNDDDVAMLALRVPG
ncbi:GAF domain-containing protein [Nonomuraea sp. KC401]|uniref:SpoIIE family protein phosphatase n=1 Tax=unclassified Nonomuraea TaxID=2593643 RepID=UPI0010FD506F|nr:MULTISPECIES: SpoIIE family protein phosphatase [unclassified Nonomuraea]NBE98241.1 SpoIIE family protein phosphatase [Nonomuraea sp. K271]TLF61641.1 GAF domain-containing protein [Nonomuraea sp. KC401]